MPEHVWLLRRDNAHARCRDQRSKTCSVRFLSCAARNSHLHSSREVLKGADFDYIVAESRHPHALHQNALYMALIRGNLDIADMILSSIISRLEERRSVSACIILQLFLTIYFQREVPKIYCAHQPRFVCDIKWLPRRHQRIRPRHSLVHARLSKKVGRGSDSWGEHVEYAPAAH